MLAFSKIRWSEPGLILPLSQFQSPRRVGDEEGFHRRNVRGRERVHLRGVVVWELLLAVWVVWVDERSLRCGVSGYVWDVFGRDDGVGVEGSYEHEGGDEHQGYGDAHAVGGCQGVD